VQCILLRKSCLSTTGHFRDAGNSAQPETGDRPSSRLCCFASTAHSEKFHQYFTDSEVSCLMAGGFHVPSMMDG
jgi:hypothetical protein